MAVTYNSLNEIKYKYVKQRFKSAMRYGSKYDKEFEKERKALLKKYKGYPSYAQKNLKKELLCKAYYSSSPQATFWWLENSPIKFTGGSDRGLRVLYAKYVQLNLTTDIWAFKSENITYYTPVVAQFFNRILPDIDYQKIGFKDKNDCVNAIAESHVRLLRDKNFEEKLKHYNKYNVGICSPFYTYELWLAFKYEQIKRESKQITNDSLHEMYETWIDNFLEYVSDIHFASAIKIGIFYDKYYDDLDKSDNPDQEHIVVI